MIRSPSQLDAHFGAAVMLDALDHARSSYPAESCGLIIGNVYLPCDNGAADPLNHFSIAAADYLAAGEALRAVVHSHPDGEPVPSADDLRAQRSIDVPFLIVTLTADRIGDLVAWGAPLTETLQ